jgi:putative ABC transport system permease protein
MLARATSYVWWGVAKLRDGVSVAAAHAELNSVAKSLDRDFPNTGRGVAASIVPLREQLSVGLTPTLRALLGAVAFVLLIACANVANLMLARATSRQKELAIRKALGAARGRVLRQLLTESALLAAAGVVIGLGIAVACFGYLMRLLPNTVPASMDLGLDLRVLAFTIATALATVLLFGAGPAFAAARRDFGAAFGRAVGALVVAEIALTVVLLAGAGLLLRSYVAVLSVDPGFDAEGVLVAETVLPAARYPAPADRDAFYRRVLERVRSLPGVENAGYTSYAPLMFRGGRALVLVEGRPRPEPSEIPSSLASNRSASSGYLETLGVQLVRGRFFDERDTRDGVRVAVINEAMARRHWPNEDPVGQRFTIGAPNGGPMTIVGVAADVRQMGLDVPADPEFFMPLEQVTTIPFMWPRQLVVRTSGDPLSLAPALRSAVWAVDPAQPVSGIRAMTEVLDTELAYRDTQLTLTGTFAVIALLLAAVGLYGVLSYTVSQSTNEIGLRMALGAAQTTVVGTVVRSALSTALAGIGVGLLATFVLTDTIASFLYGVSPTDPATAIGVAGVLLLVAGIAAFVPALRAARVNPMTALRAEG